MGVNGEQLVGENGEFKLNDSGLLHVFNQDNDSCCCDAVPPEPPDPPDPEDRYKCGTMHEWPNSVAFSLGGGWSNSEIYWLPRLDNASTYWRPIDGVYRELEPQPATVRYAANIGAVKSGDDPFGVQRWYLRNSGWNNYQGNVDVELSNIPLSMLRSGVTYQMRAIVQIVEGYVQVELVIHNGYGTHVHWPWSIVNSYVASGLSHEWLAYQTKSWKLPDHPEGNYTFGFNDDLTHAAWDVMPEPLKESAYPEGVVNASTYECTVGIPRLDYEPRRPHGHPLDRGGFYPCRQPYHAQLGANNLRKSVTYSGQGDVPPQYRSWLMSDAYDGPEYNGVDPINKYAVDPFHWQQTYISQAGYSGNSSTWPIRAIYYDSEGKATSTTRDWRVHSYIQQLAIPYDIRAEVDFSFKVYSRNFTYSRQDGSGQAFIPEMVDKSSSRWPTSYAGVRFANQSLQLRRWFGPLSTLSGDHTTQCYFNKPTALGGGSLLDSLNVGGDLLGNFVYAPEGEYQITVNVKWIDRVLSDNGWGFPWQDTWEMQIKVNQVPLEPYQLTVYQGTLYQNHWHLEMWGDNINSQYPEEPTPLLNFEPNKYIPDTVTNASNDNDAFNTGIYDFEMSTSGSHKQTNFAGNFPPFTPNFHYVTEDPTEPNLFDLELEVGTTYTLPIIKFEEFENSNRRFRAYRIETRNNGDVKVDVDSTFSIDKNTGTITWTPTFAFVDVVYVEGVSGFDQYWVLLLRVSVIDNNGGTGPAF